MKALHQIKTYLEQTMNLPDISIKKKSDEYIVARTIFYYIALEYGASKHHAGTFMNKDHASLIHSQNKMDSLFSKDTRYRDLFDDACVHFNVANEKQIEKKVTNKQNNLVNRILKERMQDFAELSQDYSLHNELIKLLLTVPEKHIETVKTRLAPIVKMLPA